MSVAKLHIPKPPSCRPVIEIEKGKLPELATLAERALAQQYEEFNVFQYGDVLSRIVTLSQDDVDRNKLIKRPVGAKVLIPMTVPMMDDVLCQAINWTDSEGEPTDVKSRISKTLLSRAGYWRHMLPLRGVIEAPCMRHDGSILNQAGYDHPTGLYLINSGVAWLTQPAPSHEAAKAALNRLYHPFREFPYTTPAGGSVILSGILTGLQRRLLSFGPGHAFDASQQSAGKTLQVECIARTLTGRSAAQTSMGKNEAEFAKKLFACYLAGDLHIPIENVKRPIDNELLAIVLTAEAINDRILGVSQTAAVPANALITITGNNLVFDGDHATRFIMSRIEPGVEHAEQRSGFEITDLPGYTLAHGDARVAVEI